MPDEILIARIGAAHGTNGAVRLLTFTEDPFAVTRYGPLSTQDGARRFEIAHARAAKGHLVAQFAGITTRNAAEALNGLDLYVPRAALPAPGQDEYYHADLVGLAAVSPTGETLGHVVAVHNFGAGDILEIAPTAGGPTLLLPFINAFVPTVDIAGGRIMIDPPRDSAGETPQGQRRREP